MRDISDEGLLRQYLAGDSRAFDQLSERHRDWILAVAVRFCGDRDLAEDVAQDTFRVLMENAPGLNLTARLRTYLYPIVRRIALRSLERSRRAQDTGVDPDALTAFPHPAGSFLRRDLTALMRELPAEQSEVVILRFVDELSLQEIADATGVPLGTVKSRLHAAIEKLRSDPRTRDAFG